MSTKFHWTYDMEGLMKIANIAKCHIAKALLKDKLITEEIYNKIVEEYALVLRDKNVFGEIWDKVWGTPDNNNMMWDVMKTVGAFGRKDGQPEKKGDTKEENRFEKLEI